MIKDIKVVKRVNKTSKIFDRYCWKYYSEDIRPSEYVTMCHQAYMESPEPKSNSLNGNIFELIIASLLVREGITPMYLQASVAFVPNVIYDVILYSSDRIPISLSLKTSLRERYKQADLEAVALKYVHRKAESYLISLNESESKDLRNKIANGSILGINDVILATDNKFDDFISSLKKRDLIIPEKVEIITAKNIIK